MKGVDTTVGDQCAYGLVANDAEQQKVPIRKRTRFVSNSPEILEELSLRCPGHEVHANLWNHRERTKNAAIYPRGLCEAVCRGLARHVRRVEGDVRRSEGG